MALLDINAALFYTFVIALLLIGTYCWRWRRYYQLGMKLPGPPALPIIGNSLQFTTNDLCKLFQELKEFARSYGPIVRFWIGPLLLVVLTDADDIQNVVKHDKLCNRGYLIRKAMEHPFRNGLLHIDGEGWLRHRRIVSAAFHNNIFEKFVQNFAKNSDILADKLKALADGITAHDIAPYLIRCCVDIIYETSCRINMHVQENNDDSIIENHEIILDTTTSKIVKPWLLIDWIFNATELGKKYNKAFKTEHGKIINEIEKRKRMRETAGNTNTRGLNDEKPSVMDILIEHGEIRREEIVGEIASVIGAGSDTIANGLGYVLALLGDNQDIQERVMQEQQDIFGDDILRPVRSDDLHRMVYLEQVFKEALRMLPPIPLHFREAMKDIDLGHGHIIPAGTFIIISACSAHRNPRHFPDPDKFDPERFSPQNSAGRHPYAYIPFGIGRRMCLGHVFTTNEAKTILSTVLRRYRLTELEGGIKGLEETQKMTFVTSPAKGFRVKLLPRSHPSHMCVT
jgi:cytochrome P450